MVINTSDLMVVVTRDFGEVYIWESTKHTWIWSKQDISECIRNSCHQPAVLISKRKNQPIQQTQQGYNMIQYGSWDPNFRPKQHVGWESRSLTYRGIVRLNISKDLYLEMLLSVPFTIQNHSFTSTTSHSAGRPIYFVTGSTRYTQHALHWPVALQATVSGKRRQVLSVSVLASIVSMSSCVPSMCPVAWSNDTWYNLIIRSKQLNAWAPQAWLSPTLSVIPLNLSLQRRPHITDPVGVASLATLWCNATAVAWAPDVGFEKCHWLGSKVYTAPPGLYNLDCK